MSNNFSRLHLWPGLRRPASSAPTATVFMQERQSHSHSRSLTRLRTNAHVHHIFDGARVGNLSTNDKEIKLNPNWSHKQ